MKNRTIQNWILLLCIYLIAVASATSAEPEKQAIKIRLNIKSKLEALSFHVQPVFIVLSGETAVMELVPENDKGNRMTLEVRATLHDKEVLDLNSTLKVDFDGSDIERDFRFKTPIGQPGFFSIRNRSDNEFLEVEITPSLVDR